MEKITKNEIKSKKLFKKINYLRKRAIESWKKWENNKENNRLLSKYSRAAWKWHDEYRKLDND